MAFDIRKEIQQLKKEKNAVILAHNYQIKEVQEIADFVGDSFELAKIGKEVEAETIVFCGVRFMAESAAILSPEKKVLLPVEDAGCPLADTIKAEDVKALKETYPGIPVVTYINSSVEVKAESDYCCTSSNAVDVVNSIDSDEVIFIPDSNLGSFVQEKTDKKLILWDGHCTVHHRVNVEDILRIKAIYDDPYVICHPECRPEVVEACDVACSTSKMIEEAKKTDKKIVILVTEEGMRHRIEKEVKDKLIVIASPKLMCVNMKKTKLQHVYEALALEQTEIKVDKEIREKALIPLKRMLEIGKKAKQLAGV